MTGQKHESRAAEILDRHPRYADQYWDACNGQEALVDYLAERSKPRPNTAANNDAS
jgi:hypothetical protein